MKKSTCFFLGVLTGMAPMAISAYFLVDYLGRATGQDIGGAVKLTMQRFEEAARPFKEANYVGRYDPAQEAFLFYSGENHQTTTTVARDGLAAFARAATPAKPKIVIAYSVADFPLEGEKSTFESGTRTALESGGASVTFFPVDLKSILPAGAISALENLRNGQTDGRMVQPE